MDPPHGSLSVSVNVCEEQESAKRCCCCAGKGRSQTPEERIPPRPDKTKDLKSILDEYEEEVRDAPVACLKKTCFELDRCKIIWVCLHGCAVLIFLVRAVWLFTHVEKGTQSEKAPKREKGVIRLAFAALYLLLGIVGPICSHFTARGRSYFQLEKLAEKRNELNESKDRRGSVASHCCRWRRIGAHISNTLVLFSPLRTMLGAVLIYEDQARYFTFGLMDEKAHHDATVAVSLIGVVGMMVFSSAEVNDDALFKSRGIVEGLVKAIEKEDACGELVEDLDNLWRLHQLVDGRLVNVWSKRCSVGTIWVSRLCVLFLISICLAAYSLYEPRRHFALVLGLGAFLSTSLSILLVYFMCQITTLCQARRAGSNSVINAVNNRMRKYVKKAAERDKKAAERDGEPGGGEEGASKDAQQLAFQDYVMTANMGIHIMGITMSFELVLKLFRYLLIYTPTAVILIGQRIHSQQ